MAKKVFLGVFFIVLVSVLSACATKGAGVPVSDLPQQISVEKLERSEYLVEKQTTGSDCSRFVLLFPLPIWWISSNETGTDVFAFKGTESTATKGAIYRALENTPNSDFLAAPRYKIEYFTALPWYSKTCVEVKAKGAKVKGDDEIVPSEKVDLELKIRKEEKTE